MTLTPVGKAAARAVRNAGRLHRCDAVVAERLEAGAGLLKFPPEPSPLAGCDAGRIWVCNGTGDRNWLSPAQAQETFTRHALEVLYAATAFETEVETWHRRWERDLLAAIEAQAAWSRRAPLFSGDR